MTGHDQFWGVIQVVNEYQFIELVKDQKSKAKPPNFKPNDWLNVEPILQNQPTGNWWWKEPKWTENWNPKSKELIDGDWTEIDRTKMEV